MSAVFRLTTAIVLGLTAEAAFGCSIALAPPKSPEQIAADRRDWHLQMLDLVEIRVTKSAIDFGVGRASVLRSVKNAVPIGSSIRIKAFPTSSCGGGDAVKGGRYRMYLHGPAPYAFFPLPPERQADLIALGLMPASWVKIP